MVIRMSDPFGTLQALQRAVDATRLSDWLGSATTGYGAYPPVNVFRKGDDFTLVAEIPGVDKNDLDVIVKGEQVRLTGKKIIDYSDDVSIHRRERVAGEFDRTVTVGSEIDADRVEAEYRNGVLTVFLPRAESAKARSVKIA